MARTFTIQALVGGVMRAAAVPPDSVSGGWDTRLARRVDLFAPVL